MPVKHPAVKARLNEQWRDVHYANDEVRVHPLRGRTESQHGAARSWREVGGAVQAVVQDAFDTNQPLRVAGGRWSLSTIGKPKSTLSI